MKRGHWILGMMLLAWLAPATAQVSMRDSAIQFTTLEIVYRGGLPSADLALRYGYLSQMGVQGGIKFASNWYFQGGVQVLFGDRVNEGTLLQSIVDDSGFMIGDQGILSDFRVGATGWVVPFSLGKIFPLGPNPNSGLYVEVGGQYLQHRLSFNTLDDDFAPVSGAYRKGYDRFTNGFGARQSIGYAFFDNRGYVNFFIGLDASQNLTRGRRSIQFDTGQPYLDRKLDLLTGFRFGWVYPIYEKAPDRRYYY